MINVLNGGESVTQKLAGLYKAFGYSRYKMNKFEEYDTYVQNKDFLISDRVITFTDVNGKLLAMKPDVTLSIIKNTDDSDGAIHRLYYKENVYRVSSGSHGFKEIMQMGLECMGDIDAYSLGEVISLAAKSLGIISDNYVLDISHMGFVSGLLNEAGFTLSEKAEALSAIGDKNIPLLNSICLKKGISDDLSAKLKGLIDIYGSIADVISKLDAISTNEETENALSELRLIFDVIKCTDAYDRVNIDFSVVNDMNYYNGLVFKGYIAGIPTGVLSGGQYDKLMKKMNKNSKALGFAVYLDLLEILDRAKNEYDADVLIKYTDSQNPAEVFARVLEYTNDGKSVVVQKKPTSNLRFKEFVDLTKGGVDI